MRKPRKRTPRATDGGSRVALAARLRPGGAHERRRKPRADIKRRAIREGQA